MTGGTKTQSWESYDGTESTLFFLFVVGFIPGFVPDNILKEKKELIEKQEDYKSCTRIQLEESCYIY